MEFDIANSSLQESAFIIAVVAAALSILATVLRFVAVKLASRKPRWEDLFAVLATFFLLAYVIPFLYLLRVMNGRSARQLSKDDIVNMTKAGWVMSAQFCPQQLFAKLSLLFLYYRAFWVSRPFVISIYVLGTIQVIWSITTYLLHWFECTPPAKLWNPKLPGYCLNAPVFLAAAEPINSLVDFALVGLAIWMVQSTKMRTAVKAKLAILFALGALAGVLGFVKIGQAYIPMGTEEVELLDPIWATVQQTFSVICCCAPVYKPLIPEFSSLRSFASRTFGGSSARGGTSQAPSDEAPKPETSSAGSGEYPGRWILLNESSARDLLAFGPSSSKGTLKGLPEGGERGSSHRADSAWV